MTGVVAGYLLWSNRLQSEPQAITVLEHMTGHPMGDPAASSWPPSRARPGAPAG